MARNMKMRGKSKSNTPSTDKSIPGKSRKARNIPGKRKAMINTPNKTKKMNTSRKSKISMEKKRVYIRKNNTEKRLRDTSSF